MDYFHILFDDMVQSLIMFHSFAKGVEMSGIANNEFGQLRFNSKIYGWILAIASLIALAFIAHHPEADFHNPTNGLENMSAIGPAGRIVHGTLIFMVLLFAIGFTGFALKIGIKHPLVMAGWISYIIGTMAMIQAASIDGFLLTDISNKMSANRQLAYDLIHLSMIYNQILARLGFCLMALGAIFWGIALIHFNGIKRLIGFSSFLIGAVSVAFVLINSDRIDVKVLLLYMIVQLVWHLIIATWMIRSKEA